MATPTTLRPHKIQRYGWIRDLPDHRDLMYAAPRRVAKIPATVDLTKNKPGLPDPYDQGELGSCTANAIGAAVQFARRKEGREDFVPSRLFIYYNERVIEGTVDYDAGAQIRDGMKVAAKLGVCGSEGGEPGTAWPYIVTNFREEPPAACYAFALKNQVLVYRRVTQTLSQMRSCLAEGFPFAFGFSVYESFESPQVAKTGVVELPGPGESVLGGHAVLAVGYSDDEQRFLVRNSWGTSWGKKGYFTMPYAYLTDAHLASDFWTVRLVE